MKKLISGKEKYFDNTSLGCGSAGKSAFRHAVALAILLPPLVTRASTAESYYAPVEIDTELAAMYDMVTLNRALSRSLGEDSTGLSNIVPAANRHKSQDCNYTPRHYQGKRFTG
jgi:hypothetical protein